MHTPEFMKLKTTSPNWNPENHFPNLHFLGAMFIFPPFLERDIRTPRTSSSPHPDLSSGVQLCVFGQGATDGLLVRKNPMAFKALVTSRINGEMRKKWPARWFKPCPFHPRSLEVTYITPWKGHVFTIPKKGHGLNHQANIFFHKFYKLSAVSALDMGNLNRLGSSIGQITFWGIRRQFRFKGCNMHGFVYVTITLRSG